jgi:uncharacterized GH25 family protein
MITVQIISQQTGKPVKGKKVSVHLNWGIMGGGTAGEDRTDENGQVEFPKADPSNGQIFIDGNTAFKGQLQGFNRIFV